MRQIALFALAAFLVAFAFLLGAVAFAVIFRGWSIASPPSTSGDATPIEYSILPPPPIVPKANMLGTDSLYSMLEIRPGQAHPANSRIRYENEVEHPLQMISILSPMPSGVLSEIFIDYMVRVDIPSRLVYEVSAERSYANMDLCLAARTMIQDVVVKAYDLEAAEPRHTWKSISSSGESLRATIWCGYSGASPYITLSVTVSDNELRASIRERVGAAVAKD